MAVVCDGVHQHGRFGDGERVKDILFCRPANRTGIQLFSAGVTGGRCSNYSTVPNVFAICPNSIECEFLVSYISIGIAIPGRIDSKSPVIGMRVIIFRPRFRADGTAIAPTVASKIESFIGMSIQYPAQLTVAWPYKRGSGDYDIGAIRRNDIRHAAGAAVGIQVDGNGASGGDGFSACFPTVGAGIRSYARCVIGGVGGNHTIIPIMSARNSECDSISP